MYEHGQSNSVLTRTDKLSLALWSLLLTLLLTLALFIPLQTDEITWSYANHRSIVDHFNAITLLPQCDDTGSYSRPIPLLWYPFALVNHALYMFVEQPLWIRIVAMLRFLFFLTTCWFIVRPMAARIQCSPVSLFIAFASLLSLSAVPLLMQTSRPEQSLMLGIAVMIALALNAEKIARHAIARYVAPVIFILDVLIYSPVHPKAIATLPILLVCTYALFRHLTKKKWAIGAALLVVIAIAAQSAIFWLDRYSCDHSALTRAMVSSHTLPWGKLFTSPAGFILAILNTIETATLFDFNLYRHLRFGWAWLPYTLTPMPEGMTIVDVVISNISLWICLGVLTLCIIFSVWFSKRAAGQLLSFRMLRKPRENKESPFPFDIYHLLSTACTFSVIGFMLIVGGAHAFYFISLDIPLLYLCALLWLAAFRGAGRYKFWYYAGIGLQIVATVNILILAYKYYPFITEPEKRGRIASQRAILISPWDYDADKQKITSAYKACGLPPVETARHLVLDDFTYPVFRSSYEPFNYHYVTNFFHDGGHNIDLLLEEMKRYHSDGIIMHCGHVPATLMPYLNKYDGYCCALGKSFP